MENKKNIEKRSFKEFCPQITQGEKGVFPKTEPLRNQAERADDPLGKGARTLRCAAFTLVEVVLVVSLIGVLAAILVPSITRGMRYWENREVAQKFQQAVLAFEEYHADHDAWPANAGPGNIPSEMNDNGGYYFKTHGIDWWTDATGIGGRWDWDYYSGLGAYISIPNPTISDEQLVELDRILDDGSLTSGVFQKGVNSSYANDYSFIADLF